MPKLQATWVGEFFAMFVVPRPQIQIYTSHSHLAETQNSHIR